MNLTPPALPHRAGSNTAVGHVVGLPPVSPLNFITFGALSQPESKAQQEGGRGAAGAEAEADRDRERDDVDGVQCVHLKYGTQRKSQVQIGYMNSSPRATAGGGITQSRPRLLAEFCA